MFTLIFQLLLGGLVFSPISFFGGILIGTATESLRSSLANQVFNLVNMFLPPA